MKVQMKDPYFRTEDDEPAKSKICQPENLAENGVCQPNSGPRLVCAGECGREVSMLSPFCDECGAIFLANCGC